MIGIFYEGVRIGSVMHFTDNGKHRFWVAFAAHEQRQQFKTRKAAIEWLVQLARAAA
jgi:hypothetical protein